MECDGWINTCCRISRCLILILVISGIGCTDASGSTLSIARGRCKEQNQQLPDLTSVRRGSLNSKLENGDSTWIDAWIERGPWIWHTTDQELHQNQGCFFTRNIFNDEKYVLESSVGDQSGCISHCINNGYAYSGLSKDSSTSFLCFCGRELPSRDERDDEKCRAQCPNGKLICGYENYARIIANNASTIEFFTWRQDGDGTSRKWCAALQFEHASKPYSPSLTQSDCSMKKRAMCVTDHRQKAYVSSKPLSWFDAQDFCHDIEVSHATHTRRLNKDTADDVLDSDEIDKTEDYWTQLSSLHLISKGSSDTFGDLPWADGYPQPEDEICIRAEKNNDEIELITADCDDRLPFICVSSDELTSTAKPESTFVKPVMSQTAESTTVLIATSTNQSDNSPMDSNAISTGVIVGAAVGGILAIIILVAIVLMVLFLRKRKSRAETPALDVANVSYGKVTKAEDNELTVIQTNEKDNEKKPNPKKEQKQKGEELEQETEENNKLTVVQNSKDGDEKKPNPKKEQKQKGKETEQETEEHNELTVVQTSEDDNKREPNPQKEEQKQKGKETEQETEEEDTLVIDNDLYGESIKRPMK